MAIRTVHEFMGFLWLLQSRSGTEMTFVERKMVPLVRPVAYRATVLAIFSSDGTCESDGYQKLYYHSFCVVSFKDLLSGHWLYKNDCRKVLF